MSFHLLLLALQLHLYIYSLLQGSTSAAGSISGLPSTVSLGTSFSTTHTLWMQSQNEVFQLDLRSWVDEGADQCMGGVRYTYKTPNALIWTFNTVPEPLLGTNCNLILRSNGVLAFELTPPSSSSRVVAWQTPTAGLRVQNLTLQDDGNLVLVNDTGGIVWQSFDSFHHLFMIPSGMRFLQNITLYDRVSLYSDFSMPGCYALQMGSQGRLQMFTRANIYVYNTIGINASTSGNNASIANYIIFNQDIEFYSSRGILMGKVAHNILNDDPLPNPTNLTGSALFKDGNLLINRPSPTNPNHHLWYYNSSISGFCDFPLVCGEYGLCNEATRECSCPPGFQRTFTKPACTAQDEPTRKCSCPEEFQMPKFNSTCVPVDDAYSLHPINVSFYPQPSAVRVDSQGACRSLCEQNASCNAALFDSNSSSCALFPVLYTVSLPSQNKATTGQVMFLKITMVSTSSGSATAIIVGATVGGAALIVIVVCLVLYWWFWWRPHNIRMQAQKRFLQDISKLPPRFTYKELEVATNNFSRRLGTGGFGSVYEGVFHMPTGITRVAVKRLDEAGASALFTMDEQFKAEVATIGSVSHVNLVTLKGFCMEKNARLLVFEFMPKGSLDRWLYTREPPQAEGSSSSASGGKKAKVPVAESSTELLDWEKRCCIALDTAKGLEYLHHQAAEHIVHCDVKPANILLSDDFHAKVGDFGLAKLTGSDAQSFAMTTLKGTRGYLAPEWLQHATITAKSDVYSYGIVLLELLTGKKCLDPEYGHLPTWVMKAVSAAKGDTTCTSTADNKMLDYDTIDASLLQEKIMDSRLLCDSVPSGSFQRVLILALASVQVDPVDRPSMTSVVQMLEDILEISYSTPSLKLTQMSQKYFPVNLSGWDSTSCSISDSEISGLGQLGPSANGR
ncbi:hypothetical protein GOP47_0022214 [Adiantum capillus-veneris]|uniref:Receptor-like serine/threonine-protein kinase n=1 Tax=Adiantum capillus-veneris TaxID=13818 RepID=A0A9D4Z7M5_ADICA|nr:hypothetical protein GOP47_0022214 [Adiantum capillus-veneris]